MALNAHKCFVRTSSFHWELWGTIGGHDRVWLDFAGLRLVQSFSVLFQGRPSYAWRAPSPSSNSLGLIGGHQDRVSSLFLSSLYNAAAHHNTKRWWSIIGSSASGSVDGNDFCFGFIIKHRTLHLSFPLSLVRVLDFAFKSSRSWKMLTLCNFCYFSQVLVRFGFALFSRLIARDVCFLEFSLPSFVVPVFFSTCC